MARAANGPFFWRPDEVERAGSWRYFWDFTEPLRSRPPMLKKTVKLFWVVLAEPLSGNRSEWNRLALLCQCFIFRQSYCSMCEHSVRRDWQAHFKKLFVSMATTSCMGVVVRNTGAEWLVGENVLCNVLMACYKCFFIYVPNYNNFTSKVEGFTFRVLGFRFRWLGLGFRFMVLDWGL